MNKQLRKAVIAGNWKMNKTPSETTQLIEEIKPLVADSSCDVVVCVPYIDLHAALSALVQKIVTGNKAAPLPEKSLLLCYPQLA